MCKPVLPPCTLPSTPLGRVAEWQTRTVQVRVSERTWGFNSPLAHAIVLDTCVRGERGPVDDLSSCWGAEPPKPPTVRGVLTQRGYLP
jgi:hypothetical protein